MTAAQLLVDCQRVCSLITDPDVSDAEVRAEIERFRRLDAPPAAMESCLWAIGRTMEQRAREHDPGSGR